MGAVLPPVRLERTARRLGILSRQYAHSAELPRYRIRTALYQSAPLILLLAPALRQSQELFRKIKHFAATSGRIFASPAAGVFVPHSSLIRL
jgi:hypothetical protein